MSLFGKSIKAAEHEVKDISEKAKKMLDRFVELHEERIALVNRLVAQGVERSPRFKDDYDRLKRNVELDGRLIGMLEDAMEKERSDLKSMRKDLRHKKSIPHVFVHKLVFLDHVFDEVEKQLSWLQHRSRDYVKLLDTPRSLCQQVTVTHEKERGKFRDFLKEVSSDDIKQEEEWVRSAKDYLDDRRTKGAGVGAAFGAAFGAGAGFENLAFPDDIVFLGFIVAAMGAALGFFSAWGYAELRMRKQDKDVKEFSKA